MDDGINNMRTQITEEIAKMRKQRLILVMHKELGEILLKKTSGTQIESSVYDEVQNRVNETIERISDLDDMIRMGEMALKIHQLIEEDNDNE